MTEPITPSSHAIEGEHEKTPEGANSYSLRLNIDSITDTLKDYALKLVANAHSEMSEQQWGDWLNEHTATYVQSIAMQEAQAVTAKLREVREGITNAWNPSTDEIYNRERHGEPYEVVYLDEVTSLLDSEIDKGEA